MSDDKIANIHFFELVVEDPSSFKVFLRRSNQYEQSSDFPIYLLKMEKTDHPKIKVEYRLIAGEEFSSVIVKIINNEMLNLFTVVDSFIQNYSKGIDVEGDTFASTALFAQQSVISLNQKLLMFQKQIELFDEELNFDDQVYYSDYDV